ncbi:hypothetical protein B0H19DRAFT_1383700 [Mycena capillaripes]|nr:hypothetical protein B0H19DRAFT_1383700 [Mycena capillaripes]
MPPRTHSRLPQFRRRCDSRTSASELSSVLNSRMSPKLSSDNTSRPQVSRSVMRCSLSTRFKLRISFNKEVEERNAMWKPSKAVAKTLREYIWTLLLLPNTRYYAGTVENAVISAARSNKVKGLPAANSNESPELVKWLGREFSIFRSDVKGAVKGSMEDGSELRNIADLADNLLQHAPGLNATLGLYYRLAFIRRHLRLSNHSIHDFWPKVDEELEDLHDAGPKISSSAI